MTPLAREQYVEANFPGLFHMNYLHLNLNCPPVDVKHGSKLGDVQNLQPLWRIVENWENNTHKGMVILNIWILIYVDLLL